jgi:molybdenum cofactor cytidylyltransferase
VIVALVLAAGASSRMGRPKALLPAGQGRTFVQAIADCAAQGGAAGMVVVTGPPHGELVRRALPLGVAAVVNPRPERGMLSSVQSGVAQLPARVSGVLVWPVDTPYVSPASVHALLQASPGKLVIPTFRGKGGHPIRIPRARFGELCALDPDVGLRALVSARPDEVVRLELGDEGLITDVDTPEDLERLPR